MRRFSRILSAFGPFLGLVFVYALFLAVTHFKGIPEFRSIYNTKTFLTHSVIVGIGALGMTFVIVSGGIDLSVGSLIALGTVVISILLKAAGDGVLGNTAAGAGAEAGVMGMPSPFAKVLLPLLAALAAIAACALCGFLNGLMISGLRIVPFIITLGMMQIARGVAKWLAGEQTVVAPDNWLNSLMDVEPRAHCWYSVAPGVWLMLGLLIALAFVLKYTVLGRHVFAIGSNEATARLCGVNVAIKRIWIYTLGGALAGVAGVMQFANLTVGDSTAAAGMELDIIAAVVIGGGSLSGGQGSALGSLVGALMMAILRNGCTMVGIPNFVQDMVIGAIIITAVGVDQLKHARE